MASRVNEAGSINLDSMERIQLTVLQDESYDYRAELSTRGALGMGARQTRMLRCSPILAGMLAVLSISLFSWGLAYKLSLYRSHQSPPKIVAAKLLSQKERPVAAQVEKAIRSSAHSPALILKLLPYPPSSNLTPVAGLEVRSPHWGAKQLFTVHTDRKPPPSIVG